MPKLVPLLKIAPRDIEQLLDDTFGRDRHGRTAYKIREGVDWLPDFSFAAVGGEGLLLGTAQSWPVKLTPPDGDPMPLLMVGPVAVKPEAQGHGIGQMLTDGICEVLDAQKKSAMMIGDPEYYERFFGFWSGPASRWTLPGPVEPHRILLRGADGSEWPAHGTLGADLLHSPR